ncbi:MAG: hypothetical protein WC728_05040 [Elusimicrobiota bacterium]
MRHAALFFLILSAPAQASAANVLSLPRAAAAPGVGLAPVVLQQPSLSIGIGLGPTLNLAPTLPAVPAVPSGVQVRTPEPPAAQYLDDLLGQTRRLYQRYFPEFDVGFKVDMAFSAQPGVQGTKGSHEVDPRKKQTPHAITLIEDASPRRSNERERTLTPFARDMDRDPGLFGAPIQRWVSRTITLFHEYAHGVFHELTPAISRGFNLPENDMLRADVAMVLDEGFAVTMELLLIDRMIADAGELGLTPEDVSDLRIRKKQRLHDMRYRKDHYAAGTYYFMHRLYKREGEDGILRFLKDLDMERLYTLFTYDPSYRLIQGSPELFEAYLTKSGDARLREGVDALAAYIAGGGDAAGLKDVLRRVDRSALTRIARLYRKASVAESDPAIYRGFVERIAALDPEAARNMRESPQR